jgi:hypothetical protein
MLARILPAFLLGSGVLFSGCSFTSPAKNSSAGYTFELVKTNFLGSLWNESQAKARVVSQDGGESFTVPGGAVWAFGDTFKGSRAADGTPHFEGGAVSCSLAFLPEGARTYPPEFQYFVSSNGVVSPFRYFPDESLKRNRIWPNGGIHLNGHNYLYYYLIEVYGNGSFDFRITGSGLARSEAALGPYERLRPNGDWRFPVAPTQILEKDGWIYLFSIADLHGKRGVALARVRPEKIEDPRAYEYYAGTGPIFSPDKKAAAILVNNIAGQTSVAWNGYLRKYVMAGSSDFSHPFTISFYLANSPWGPWSGRVAQVKVPEIRQGKHVNVVYCTYFHPELFQENGRIMILTFTPGLKDSGFDGNCEMLELQVR